MLKGKGHTPKRPDYKGAAAGGKKGDDEKEEEEEEEEAAMDDEDDDDEVDEKLGKTARTPLRKNATAWVSSKRNYEDTSEDE